VLTQEVESNGYPAMADKVLGSVRIMGANTVVSSVTVNGQPHTDFTNLPGGEIRISNLSVAMTSNFDIALG
jgi:hypothetical protein